MRSHHGPTGSLCIPEVWLSSSRRVASAYPTSAEVLADPVVEVQQPGVARLHDQHRGAWSW